MFTEKKGEVYKVLGIYAKRARGSLVNYIILIRLKSSEGLTEYVAEGYRFDKELCSDASWVYLRD